MVLSALAGNGETCVKITCFFLMILLRLPWINWLNIKSYFGDNRHTRTDSRFCKLQQWLHLFNSSPNNLLLSCREGWRFWSWLANRVARRMVETSMEISGSSGPCVPLQAWGVVGAISPPSASICFPLLSFSFTFHPHKHMHTLKRRGCFWLPSKDRNHTQTQKKLGEETVDWADRIFE